jgi:hypothetical protein
MTSDGQHFAGKNARIWNPTSGTFTSVNIGTGTNIFCAGHVHLPDGRILVAGGHLDNDIGLRDTNIFNPTTRQWTRVASMLEPRWYPTLTVLPDGRVLAMSGETACPGCYAQTPEIYNPATNTWTVLTAAQLPIPYYPYNFILPDGRILVAGSSEASIITRTLNVQSQAWTVVDANPVDGGSAVMYLPGKVMKSGTSQHPSEPTMASAPTTYVLDMAQPSPLWRQTASMASPRTFHNLTMLPDGNVLATGGGLTTGLVDLENSVLSAEMWSPASETWTTLSAMQKPRLYHSTALLLPDARVLVMGGGRIQDSNDPVVDQSNAEIYSPPYLFRGSRPVIASAPTSVGYGSTVTVQTPDAARIASVALVKVGSVTHTNDMGQRFVPLPFTIAGNSLNLQTPPNANLAPPGHYMLFIVDTNGIPSIAPILRVQ